MNLKLPGQTVLTIEGKTINNTEADYWDGDPAIVANTPTQLIYRNNSITSKNASGYMVPAGFDNENFRINYLDNAAITGNKIEWKGTEGTTHGIFVGYNINQTIKYNYCDRIPLGIIFKSGKAGGPNMTCTTGGMAYNIIKNSDYGVSVKGINGVQIFNNTFYSDKKYGVLLMIFANQSFTPLVYSTGAKIKNNIFYTVNRIACIDVESGGLKDFESDYNVFYCESGDPVINVDHVTISFADWQSLGYDKHSLVINPQFNNTVEFVPVSRLNYGINLGPLWQDGLSTKAVWSTVNPALVKQDDNWQVGARIYSGSLDASFPSNPDTNVKVYPNPASHFLNIQIGDLGSIEYVVSMFNSLCQKVQSLTTYQKFVTLDLEGVPGGIYLIEIRFINEHIVKKVIIEE